MPKAVRRALQFVCTDQGGMDDKESERFLEMLEETGRLQEETWS